MRITWKHSLETTNSHPAKFSCFSTIDGIYSLNFTSYGCVHLNLFFRQLILGNNKIQNSLSSDTLFRGWQRQFYISIQYNTSQWIITNYYYYLLFNRRSYIIIIKKKYPTTSIPMVTFKYWAIITFPANTLFKTLMAKLTTYNIIKYRYRY